MITADEHGVIRQSGLDGTHVEKGLRAVVRGDSGDDVLLFDDTADHEIPEGSVALVVVDGDGKAAHAILTPAEVGFLAYALARHQQEV